MPIDMQTLRIKTNKYVGTKKGVSDVKKIIKLVEKKK